MEQHSVPLPRSHVILNGLDAGGRVTGVTSLLKNLPLKSGYFLISLKKKKCQQGLEVSGYLI